MAGLFGLPAFTSRAKKRARTGLKRMAVRPFAVALLNGDRYEFDRPETLAIGEGRAVLVAPGNGPVFLDHEGVNQVIGDLSGRGAEAT